MKKSGNLNTTIKTLAYATAGLLHFNSHAAVVINEFDYDQPGADNTEFIELYNSGSSAISLDNYVIELINGNNSSTYRSIDLAGFNIEANGFFVVCGDSGIVNCDYSFISSSSWFQNGAPDAIALYEDTQIVDSVSYEGVLFPFTEGDTLTVQDNNTDIVSIGRISDGFDSDNNATDFELNCLTPGSANIAGSGDCSAAVSAVPVPAAVWLFGSGLLGLVGVARQRRA